MPGVVCPTGSGKARIKLQKVCAQHLAASNYTCTTKFTIYSF